MTYRFHEALQTVAAPLRAAMIRLIGESQSISWLSAKQVAKLQTETGMDQRAIAEALLPLAASFAVVPISSFPVGAICHGGSGAWFFGANQEFSGTALNQTVHAEQSAIVNAWNQQERVITAITVNYPPCGHCRQFINELPHSQSIQLQLPNRAISTIANYLPDAFGPSDMGITASLLQHSPQPGVISGDPLEQAAKLAACRSYAPYSQSYSGVSLLTKNHQLFTGSYAENAAFNPSLSPLQAALISLHLADANVDAITDVVLAESRYARISQASSCSEVLSAIGYSKAIRIVYMQ